MWPFSSYPESSPSEVNGKCYDYIIVGGGTAGCVLASRLSEGNTSVLVLEKGHFKDNIVSRIPLISQNMFLGDALQVQSNRWSEPLAGANGRRNRLWAVEGIGGASRINAMLWTRGFPADYKAWSDMGLNDWSYEKLEPYFRRIENTIVHPDSPSRGREGPIELRQCPYPFVWAKCIDEATHKLGLRPVKDLNEPTAPAMGHYNLDTAIDARGNRISALTAYLNKKIVTKRRDRLTICTGTIASRLELDPELGHVKGVHIRSSTGPPREYYVEARREVIICSGAACSPQLLLLSGLGPAQSSKAFGIPLVKELPAVGATLSDHYSIPIMMEVPKKETFHLLQSIWGVWHILLWLFFGKGFLSLTSMSTTIYARTGAIDKDTMEIRNRDEEGRDNLDSSQTRNVPDIEIMFMPNSAVERAVDGHTLISLYPTLVQPHGSGRVELASKDPVAQPRITYPMFTTGHDLTSARLAVRFTMRLAEELQGSDYPYPAKIAFGPGQEPTMLEEWERAAPPDYLPVPLPATSSTAEVAIDSNKPRESKQHKNKTWRDVTDDEIDDYMRRVSHTSLHFASTCPMSNDAKKGVVDQQLRVHGFSNLRIADTSVFPKIPSCHTMAPVMVVAERCADMVKATWETKEPQ
ncbi:putative GMC oxidoreductase [Xylariomycetidae sp. FL0641]|nr:putative GMC oxidoreductase [Xylariomycetidae sp. FL0641]